MLLPLSSESSGQNFLKSIMETTKKVEKLAKNIRKLDTAANQISLFYTWLSVNQTSIELTDPNLFVGQIPIVPPKKFMSLTNDINQAIANGSLDAPGIPILSDAYGTSSSERQKFNNDIQGALIYHENIFQYRYELETLAEDLKEIKSDTKKISDHFFDLVKGSSLIRAFYNEYLVYDHFKLIAQTIPLLNKAINDTKKMLKKITKDHNSFVTRTQDQIQKALDISNANKDNLVVIINNMVEQNKDWNLKLQQDSQRVFKLQIENDKLALSIKNLRKIVDVKISRVSNLRNASENLRKNRFNLVKFVQNANHLVKHNEGEKCLGQGTHTAFELNAGGKYACMRPESVTRRRDVNKLKKEIKIANANINKYTSQITPIEIRIYNLNAEIVNGEKKLVADGKRLSEIDNILPELRTDIVERLRKAWYDDTLRKQEALLDLVQQETFDLESALYEFY